MKKMAAIRSDKLPYKKSRNAYRTMSKSTAIQPTPSGGTTFKLPSSFAVTLAFGPASPGGFGGVVTHGVSRIKPSWISKATTAAYIASCTRVGGSPVFRVICDVRILNASSRTAIIGAMETVPNAALKVVIVPSMAGLPCSCRLEARSILNVSAAINPRYTKKYCTTKITTQVVAVDIGYNAPVFGSRPITRIENTIPTAPP
mmetsp:Transcript_19509/g.47100  ORF Transcript_19509/g.47100 Transcript_19509/m.47100 type:complete len:202 (+) Transcript_19509:202-807(+)